MARSPMLDVGKRGSCFTGLENHFGKNDPLWIFNPLSSGSSPKHCLKCLKVFEVQFTIYAPLLSGVYKWSLLWILGTDCKHINETFSWKFMTNSRGPSWVLKIEFDVISEQVFDAWCNVHIPLSNGRHEKLDLLWLFIEIMPATTWKFFQSWKYKKAGKTLFSLFWVIFRQTKVTPRVFTQKR